MHPACLRDRQEQQIQLVQGHGHLWEKAVGAPADLRWYAGGTVGCLMVLLEHKVLEGLGEARQIQPRRDLGSKASRSIPRQPREEALVHGIEEALDTATAAGLA